MLNITQVAATWDGLHEVVYYTLSSATSWVTCVNFAYTVTVRHFSIISVLDVFTHDTQIMFVY